MKAIVIGGTKGFGRLVSSVLEKRGYYVVTVGRSGEPYAVDVGNQHAFETTLDRITTEQGSFDLAIFIAGFARASDPATRTETDWDEHKQKNVGYVEAALKRLTFLPGGTVVTTGSQWSYQTGEAALEPYIQAKHALKELTERFAQTHPELSVVHLAVPPMKTEQRDLVWERFGKKPETKSDIHVADPSIVAESFVQEALDRPHHGETIQIDSLGNRHLIETRVHTESRPR